MIVYRRHAVARTMCSFTLMHSSSSLSSSSSLCFSSSLPSSSLPSSFLSSSSLRYFSGSVHHEASVTDDSPARHMLRDGIGRGLATGLAFSAPNSVDSSPSSSSSSSTSSPTPSPPPASSPSLPTPYLSGSGSGRRFQIAQSFVNKYRSRDAPFGFNGLGALVYRRTYSRKKSEGGEGVSGSEEWFETVSRVVNGTYNMQKQWIDGHGLGWNAWKAQKSAQEMYSRIFDMKFLPPGRGLWAMGSPVTEERKLYAALNNCAFVSTASMVDDPSKPFTFLMDASMLGVGVGFDTEGAGKVVVKGVNKESSLDHVIADSREGWVDALRAVLMAYFKGYPLPRFDYSQIRPFGTPIKGFGGVASGPDALKQLLECVGNILEKRTGTPLTVTDIVDIMNLIGRCVIAGNVRRTAEIAFGSASSEEYLDLKNYSVNPQRAEWGWTSNNSIFASIGMDYSDATRRIRINGEPGLAWLDNMKQYGRMNGIVDNRDHRAQGGNPCLEQTLESYELCCLVETFPARHETKEDFLRTLKFAYLYAKTVTLGQTQWPETNRVMLRNRRIGCSISGVAQFLAKHSIETLREWLEDGYKTIQHYDQEYSDWLAIPRSIKTTSVKPSGTVSLLAGSTPGMHYPESRFYIRRVRLSAASELLAPLKAAGYPIEAAVGDAGTVVVEIPVDAGEGVRTAQSVSMWEQLSLAAFLQRHWADNQVSCTITFDPETEGPQIANALNYYQYQLKGISFLPRMAKGAYPQMPYEEISEQEYKKRQSALKPLQLSSTRIGVSDTQVDRFCDGDVCEASPQSDARQQNQTIQEEKTMEGQ